MSNSITNSSSAVLANLNSLLPDLESVYKDLHAHPELSMQERRTAGIAADRLRAAGYEVTTGVGKTGVAGLLHNGEGPVVMLRADMDALSVEEATGLPYASKITATDSTGKTVPVMHACGHDMHVTWLIGAATLFAKSQDAWKRDADARLSVIWPRGARLNAGGQHRSRRDGRVNSVAAANHSFPGGGGK